MSLGVVIPKPFVGRSRFASGRYYGAAGPPSTSANAQSALRASPFLVGQKTRFDQIALEVTVGAASSFVRLGVYATDREGMPSALLLDSGQLDASTAAVKTQAIDLTLEAGLYALASVSQGGTPTVRSLTSSATGAIISPPTFGLDDLASISQTGITVDKPSIPGALPDPFPSNPGGNAAGARVMLRAA